MAYNWTCPYCDRDTTITENNHSKSVSNLVIKNSMGTRQMQIEWVVCPNPDCQKFSVYISFFEYNLRPNIWEVGKYIETKRIIPESEAKVLPDYIPEAIKSDYEEACKIKFLSPKASATLSRRCLQGMIRDFWGIKKSRLIDEINDLKDKIDPLTWNSIDATRKIGNIGAHMEKDIDLIIDVEPDEATILIQLIELLIVEWYVYKHERELKLKSIIDISQTKENKK